MRGQLLGDRVSLAVCLAIDVEDVFHAPEVGNDDVVLSAGTASFTPCSAAGE